MRRHQAKQQNPDIVPFRRRAKMRKEYQKITDGVEDNYSLLRPLVAMVQDSPENSPFGVPHNVQLFSRTTILAKLTKG